MALIFLLSNQVAEESKELSQGITEKIIQTVERVAPAAAEWDLERVNHFVRKNAHFFAYFVLGMLVWNALRVTGVRGLRRYGLALLICVLYAISDEIHQAFVPGRGPQVRDVFIDSAGTLSGFILCRLAARIGRRSR
jgi:VanZ family protein